YGAALVAPRYDVLRLCVFSIDFSEFLHCDLAGVAVAIFAKDRAVLLYVAVLFRRLGGEAPGVPVADWDIPSLPVAAAVWTWFVASGVFFKIRVSIFFFVFFFLGFTLLCHYRLERFVPAAVAQQCLGVLFHHTVKIEVTEIDARGLACVPYLLFMQHHGYPAAVPAFSAAADEVALVEHLRDRI